MGNKQDEHQEQVLEVGQEKKRKAKKNRVRNGGAKTFIEQRIANCFGGKLQKLLDLKYILGGVLIGIGLFCCFLGVFALWFFLPMELNWNFALPNLVLIFLMPLVAGWFAGIKIGKNGMKNGFLTGILLWCLLMAVYIFLLPELMSLGLFLGYWLVCAFMGTAGGLCGVNIYNLRQALKIKEKPKV